MKGKRGGVNYRKQKRLPSGSLTCDRERIRTFDRLLRRQMLYPAELRDLMIVCLKSYNSSVVIVQGFEL